MRAVVEACWSMIERMWDVGIMATSGEGGSMRTRAEEGSRL